VQRRGEAEGFEGADLLGDKAEVFSGGADDGPPIWIAAMSASFALPI
jgi:hypothetical protein